MDLITSPTHSFLFGNGIWKAWIQPKGLFLEKEDLKSNANRNVN